MNYKKKAKALLIETIREQGVYTVEMSGTTARVRQYLDELVTEAKIEQVPAPIGFAAFTLRKPPCQP